MAQSGRFALSLKVLTVLAAKPAEMLTSAVIAEELGESAVMVRRMFLLLHKAGWIVQRKGPNGGAQLKVGAKQIGLGDVFEAATGDWLAGEDKSTETLLKKVRSAAIETMNETTVAQVLKRAKKG
ncbi:RrF2 family transcriptional regulator [Granulicella arctica]|uniref:DNA-binding IscR family transcriptional regulator n=1 Tax=Granulicella arctica TaxID=940613 RepID=A0A7Y9TLJ9_9BACT|nr:Rrf2 family transcriptional regulator [Granulicella arctica]NYF80202.1 DNA-binding IscR family transcriptional regulator [Granulicella arctica]